MGEAESKGHLNPGDAGVAFDRFELGGGLGELVRHVWVVRWTLPPGLTRPQRVLSYPAFNVVMQPEGTVLAGPDPRLSITELTGSSWAVGILFRPAAGSLLARTAGHPPGALVGAIVPYTGAPLAAVTQAMAVTPASVSRRRLVAELRGWLLPLAGLVDDRGRLMNRVGRLAETDDDVLRSAELADRAGIGVRTLERLVREHVGVSPKWLIECRRLQQAATTLHAHPQTELSALAAELGYADYPHFSRRYRLFLGETPDATRRAAGLEAAERAGAQ